MNPESIRVYTRVRPCFDSSLDFPGVIIDELDPFTLRFNLPAGVVSHNSSQFRFRFSRIFWKDSEQSEIFDEVASPLIDHALAGFNATLFAYGQTGSGKTYSITGDGSKERAGIVPRAIEYVYQKKTLPEFKNLEVKISYLEIYNNIAYDLLAASSNKQMQKLEDLTKVTFVDNGKKTLMKDLSVEDAPTFEAAHKLFWSGESARKKAATVNNKYSSRSHTIFSLIFKMTGETKMMNSQINFVDLAGSEKYDSLDGEVDQRKREARAINVSLHNLQQVIIGIKEKHTHIPFRDSVLTRFLKDSLVGNVKTSMIATLSTNRAHISESINSCRFSESVSEVKTKTFINETEMTQSEIIEKLKKQVNSLRDEISTLKSSQRINVDHSYSNDSFLSYGTLSDDESVQIKENINRFLNDETETIHVTNMTQVNFCFQYLKQMISKDYSSSLKVSLLTQKLKESESKVNRLLAMMREKQKNHESGDNIISREAAFIQFRNTHEKYGEELSFHEQLKTRCRNAEELSSKASSLKSSIKSLNSGIGTLEAQEEDIIQKMQGESNENKIRKLEESLLQVRNAINAKEEEIESITMEFNNNIKTLNNYKGDIEVLQNKLVQAREIVQKDFKEFWENTIIGYSDNDRSMTPRTLKVQKQRFSTLRPRAPTN